MKPADASAVARPLIMVPAAHTTPAVPPGVLGSYGLSILYVLHHHYHRCPFSLHYASALGFSGAGVSVCCCCCCFVNQLAYLLRDLRLLLLRTGSSLLSTATSPSASCTSCNEGHLARTFPSTSMAVRGSRGIPHFIGSKFSASI